MQQPKKISSWEKVPSANIPGYYLGDALEFRLAILANNSFYVQIISSSSFENIKNKWTIAEISFWVTLGIHLGNSFKVPSEFSPGFLFSKISEGIPSKISLEVHS